MSSRALRKLHGNRDLNVLNGQNDDEEDEDLETDRGTSNKKNRKPQNPFLLVYCDFKKKQTTIHV